MINCFNFITTRIDDSQWRQRATDIGGGGYMLSHAVDDQHAGGNVEMGEN